MPSTELNTHNERPSGEVAIDAATCAIPTSRTGRVHSQGEVLRRADGIELIGEFEGSGFKNPPLLARRADGQVIQLTKLLYEVSEASDGHRDAQAVAEVVSRRCGRTVNASDIAFLAERKLRPLGILALPDGTTPVLKKRPPVMALRHRKPLLSERAVNAAAWAFTWLHVPFVQAPLLLALAAFDVWLFGVHGIAGGLRSALYDPVLLLAVLASVVIATAFHEFGHASGCRYAGARPGAMGVGVYLVWPVFYCDVTDAYRLNRAGRLRTDLGGIYFNAVFALLAGGAFLVTGEQAALLAAFVQHLLILQQLIPLMRFDGYYVMTDLTGVPDILSRIKPIFRSLLQGREHEPRVAELKPWVRWVVTSYVVALVPALLLLFAWMLIATPRVIATMCHAFVLQLDSIGRASLAEMAVGGVRTTMLALQLGGMALSVARVGRMAGQPLLRWSRGSVPRTGGMALGAAALLGAAAFIWWPHGDYRPIQPGDRGTVQDGLNSLVKLVGRDGFHAGNHGAASGGDASRATGGAVRTATSAGATVTDGGTSGGWQTTPGAPGRDGARATGGRTTPSPGTTTTTGTGPTTTRPTPGTGTGHTTAAPTPPRGGTGTGPAPTTGGSDTTGTATTPGDQGGNSMAVAVNTTDYQLVFNLTFAIISVTGDVVDNLNVADAYASCNSCRTVAVSIQTLLVDSAASVVAPINEAVARNQNCERCDTVAIAYQFVIAAGAKLEFTPQGRWEIAYILRQLGSLPNQARRSGMTGAQITAVVTALMEQYAGVLSTELVAASRPGDGGNKAGTSGTTSPAAATSSTGQGAPVPTHEATSPATNSGPSTTTSATTSPTSTTASTDTPGAAAGATGTTPTSAPTDSGTTPTTTSGTTGTPTDATTTTSGSTTSSSGATTTTSSSTTSTTP